MLLARVCSRGYKRAREGAIPKSLCSCAERVHVRELARSELLVGERRKSLPQSKGEEEKSSPRRGPDLSSYSSREARENNRVRELQVKERSFSQCRGPHRPGLLRWLQLYLKRGVNGTIYRTAHSAELLVLLSGQAVDKIK